MYFCIEKTGISLKQEKVAVLDCDFYITFFTYEKVSLKLLYCSYCKIFISTTYSKIILWVNLSPQYLGIFFRNIKKIFIRIFAC